MGIKPGSIEGHRDIRPERGDIYPDGWIEKEPGHGI